MHTLVRFTVSRRLHDLYPCIPPPPVPPSSSTALALRSAASTNEGVEYCHLLSYAI